MELKLSKKYKAHLKLYGSSSDSFREKFLLLIQDVSNHAEGIWDYNSIRYSTIMTKKQWEVFSTHPERKQYKSKIFSKKDLNKNKDIVYELIKDSYAYYKILRSSSYKKKLKSSIGLLIDTFLNAAYEIEELRFADTYSGRPDKDRDSGKVNPTLVSQSSLDFAIKEYAYFSGKDYSNLKKKLYKICDGRISILSDYFYTCDLKASDRKEIHEIMRILSRDMTLTFFDIKLGWEIWKKLRKAGIDLNSYLDLIDLPSDYEVIKTKLLKFMKDKELVEEVLEHLKDDLPNCYKKYKKQGYIKVYDLIEEEARRKKYPKKLRSTKQIKKMIKESQQEVYRHFPLAKKPSPRNIIMNPTHPESTGRAFQSSVKNSKLDRVNTIVMSPRSDLKDKYLPTLAH